MHDRVKSFSYLQQQTMMCITDRCLLQCSYMQLSCSATHSTTLRYKTWRVGEEVLTSDEEGVTAAAVDWPWC